MRGESAGFTSGLCPETVTALRLAGWTPERRLDVTPEIRSLETQGYVPSAVATSFLEEFRGLKVGPAREDGPNFINGEPFFVDPVGAGSRHRDESLEIGSVLGGSWFPLGWWLSHSHVFMRQDGAVVAYADGLIWDLRSTPGEALDLMVSANRPLVCLHASHGMKPWPR
ncbi:SUKH-3 domain-containing protein [Streptomyces filamentosus]|uniref:SUKH-3 domain-containing protein n=1 Tax=Streptomyces filamentosus TaxID=67294 RepID=UPI001478970C|nr:SUKH-3 domain-containing protein [Streptomyces filamentosus]